jgi:hypothetical protein
MEFHQTSGRTDNNWFDSAEGVLFFYRQRLAQFQLRMDRGMKFQLILMPFSRQEKSWLQPSCPPWNWRYQEEYRSKKEEFKKMIC